MYVQFVHKHRLSNFVDKTLGNISNINMIF